MTPWVALAIPHWLDSTSGWMLLVCGVAAMWFNVPRLVRARRAARDAELVLPAIDARDRRALVAAVVIVTVTLGLAVVVTGKLPTGGVPGAVGMLSVLLGSTIGILTVTAITEDGVAVFGRLVRWEDIQSWEWGRGNCCLLRHVQFESRRPRSARARGFYVPPELHHAVETRLADRVGRPEGEAQRS